MSAHAEFLRVASGDAALPEALLAGDDERLPGRSAALARYAAVLTAQPWAVTDEHGLFAEHGLDGKAIQAATGVVAMFNYFTRVADASGIEFDYLSPLPAFQPRREQESVPRPDRADWPVVTAEHRRPPDFPAFTEAWQHWREYLSDSEEPLPTRERRLLARAAAEECCDRWQADLLAEHTPRDEGDSALDAFARKLSLRPWQMEPTDLQALRDAGFAEPALLHAISVVAQQNAESRLALGHGLTTR